MWASTHNGTLAGKMAAVVDALHDCQAAAGTGYLSAFPAEFFDRFEAIRPVWAPYYTIHKARNATQSICISTMAMNLICSCKCLNEVMKISCAFLLPLHRVCRSCRACWISTRWPGTAGRSAWWSPWPTTSPAA
jgi:hypothetical protein